MIGTTVAVQTCCWGARRSLSTLTCSCIWRSAIVVRADLYGRASADRRRAKETRRWCAHCSTTHAPIAVGSGAIGLRAERRSGAEARFGGGALGRRVCQSVEVETAAALIAPGWIAITGLIARRTCVAETQGQCRRLAISPVTKFKPPTPPTNRPTRLAFDVRVEYGRC